MSSTDKNSNPSSAALNSMQPTNQIQPLVNQIAQPTQIYCSNANLISTGSQLYFRPMAFYNTATMILTPIAVQPTAYQPSFQQLQQYVIVLPSLTSTILYPGINNNLQNTNNNAARTVNASVGQTSGQNSVPPVLPESSDQFSSSTNLKIEEVTAENADTSITCETPTCMQALLPQSQAASSSMDCKPLPNVTPNCMQSLVPQSQAASSSMDCKPLPETDETQKSKNCKADGGKKVTLKHSCHVVGCGKVFNRPSLLKKHLRTHGGKKNVFCAHCEKGYTRKSQLRVHLKSHEDSELNDKSEDGNKIKGPDGKVRYFCRFPNCRKFFRDDSTLKSHENGHSGNKDKSVSTHCGKELSQKNELALHEETMHTNVQRNKPKGKRSVYSAKKQTQKERLTCRVEGCGRVYASVGNLNAHIKLHNNERPFACTVCGKKYSFACYLRVHEQSHRGKK